LHGANQLDYLVGACAIAYYVAKVGDGVILRSRLQTGLESFKVSVNVTDEE
jgi:hypothetical protein